MKKPLVPVLLAAVLAAASACDAAISASAQQADAPAGHAAVQVTPGENAQGAAVQGEAPKAAAQAEVTAELKPEQLDLESINYLAKKGKVKDAAQLEKQINDPKEKLHSIDIDGDGKLDKIQIVEVKKPDGVIVFELKAVPKDKDAAIVVAIIDFVPDKASGVLVVKAHYAPCFIGYDTIVYDYTVPIVVKGDVIVVSDGPAFFGWLFLVSRPVYVSVIIIDVPTVYHVKHKHKHKHKGKWKGKGKWH